MSLKIGIPPTDGDTKLQISNLIVVFKVNEWVCKTDPLEHYQKTPKV